MTLGQLIHECRVEAKISMTELGRMRGLKSPYPTVWSWETDKRTPSVATIAWMGRLFGDRFKREFWNCI